MQKVVWIDDWELQCCGEPFRLGSEVVWDLSPEIETEYAATVLSDDVASSLTDRYDRHGPSATRAEVYGTVRAIKAAFCEFSPKTSGSPGPLYPVAGTGTLDERSTADGWEPEGDSRRFVGYVVDLEVPDKA